MGLSREDYDDQFIAMNVGAHRKPSQNIGAPALVWHLGFWRPNVDRAPDTDDVTTHDYSKSWYRNVDYFLFLIFLTARNLFGNSIVCPNYDPAKRLYLFRTFFEVDESDSAQLTRIQSPRPILSSERLSRHDLFHVAGEIASSRLTIRASLAHEYWTLTFSWDLSTVNVGTDGPKFDALEEAVRNFGIICDFVEKRHNDHYSKDEAEKIDLTHSQVAKAAKDLTTDYRKFIEEYFLEVCHNLMNTLGQSLPNETRLHDELLGKVFADFQGTIFGVTGLADEPQPILRSVRAGGQRPSAPDMTHTIMGQVKSTPLSEDNVAGVVDAFWPAIKTLHEPPAVGPASKAADSKREYTVSRLQSGRALYISSLGRLKHTIAETKFEPVIYTVITTYRSRWATGRMINRLHYGGVLRLAAVRDLGKLVVCSDRLRILEHKINSSPADAVRRAGQYDREFRLIGNTDWIRNGSQEAATIANGIMYRIERSRYYVRAFKRLGKSHRLGRVEGFQRYDEFVLRRLGDTYDFINRLGLRYVELRSEIELILNAGRSQTAIKQLSYTNLLLRLAEFGSFFPIAYYSGNVVSDITLLDRQHSMIWGLLIAGTVILFAFVAEEISKN